MESKLTGAAKEDCDQCRSPNCPDTSHDAESDYCGPYLATGYYDEACPSGCRCAQLDERRAATALKGRR